MVKGFKEEGLVKQDLTIEEAKFQQLMAEFM
jgi:2-oxoglutarate ferredoxin oxidoreductase subunit beta